MGLGLYLLGRLRAPWKDPQEGLRDFAAWFGQSCPETLIGAGLGTAAEGAPALYLRLHPSAEDVQVVALNPERVMVTAKTSPSGPGYHRYLCRLLQDLGSAKGVVWDAPDAKAGTGDETGFFYDGIAAAVDDEVLAWLKNVALRVQGMLGDDYAQIMISLPPDHQFDYDGVVATPLGPRDREWLEATAAHPEHGKDVFPWWQDGVGADFHLGWALARMWTEVCWRPPAHDKETNLLRGVADRLAKARRLDPSLPFPWAEWNEILAYLETSDPEVGRRAGTTPPRIGYRRRPVYVDVMGGWKIRIPGSMWEEFDEDGSTWSAWEPGRTVWFSSLEFQPKEGLGPKTPAGVLDTLKSGEGERLDFTDGDVAGRAFIRRQEEAERKLWHLEGKVAKMRQVALCNIYYENAADRDWAVETWKSVRNPSD